MKQITHSQKVMWRLYCRFSHYPLVRLEGFWGSYRDVWSKEAWDFLHSNYYYVTQIDPVFSGTFKEFCDYFSYDRWTVRRKNPYNYKKTWVSRRQGWGDTHRYPISRWDHAKSKAYRRKPHHKKKEVSDKERDKREWKKRKCKNKTRHCYHDLEKAVRKYSHRQERRYVKSCLKSGKYDINPKKFKVLDYYY